MNTRNKAGFTLVELMVVAIIVAILAAVAIPLITANKKRAMFSEGQAGVGHVRTAQRVYQAEHGTYKTHSGALSAGNMPGIGITDLDGKYFVTSEYTMEATPSNYTIRVTGGTKTPELATFWMEINQDGIWTNSAGL